MTKSTTSVGYSQPVFWIFLASGFALGWGFGVISESAWASRDIRRLHAISRTAGAGSLPLAGHGTTVLTIHPDGSIVYEIKDEAETEDPGRE